MYNIISASNEVGLDNEPVVTWQTREEFTNGKRFVNPSSSTCCGSLDLEKGDGAAHVRAEMSGICLLTMAAGLIHMWPLSLGEDGLTLPT